MTNIAVRVALVVVAVLATAWLAFGLRAVRLQDDANAVVDRARAGPVSETDVRRAQDWLRAAKRLNPDEQPVIDEGQLLYAIGRDREATFVARAAAVHEPDNLQAWFLAWVADPDPKSKEQALAQLRRLNPFIEVAIGLRGCIACPLRPR